VIIEVRNPTGGPWKTQAEGVVAALRQAIEESQPPVPVRQVASQQPAQVASNLVASSQQLADAADDVVVFHGSSELLAKHGLTSLK